MTVHGFAPADQQDLTHPRPALLRSAPVTRLIASLVVLFALVRLGGGRRRSRFPSWG